MELEIISDDIFNAPENYLAINPLSPTERLT